MDLEPLKALTPAEKLIPGTWRYDTVHDAFDLELLNQEAISRVSRLYDALMAISQIDSFERLFNHLKPEVLRQDIRSLDRGISQTTVKERKAIHDIRGGPVFGIVCLEPEQWNSVCKIAELQILAREQAKLMRGIFPFIDPDQASKEESTIQVHSTGSFLKSWNKRVVVSEGKQAGIKTEVHYQGEISCRCIETSALDRVLINLTNNAARFSTTDTSIHLVVFKVSEHLTRWCVLNSIEPSQQAWLKDKLPDNGLGLFQSGVTTESTGLGLSSTVDVMSQIFRGIGPEDLVRDGYLGVSLLEDCFCAWFHWPIYHPKPGETACDCQS